MGISHGDGDRGRYSSFNIPQARDRYSTGDLERSEMLVLSCSKACNRVGLGFEIGGLRCSLASEIATRASVERFVRVRLTNIAVLP
jgi:hypothetical protein